MRDIDGSWECGAGARREPWIYGYMGTKRAGKHQMGWRACRDGALQKKRRNGRTGKAGRSGDEVPVLIEQAGKDGEKRKSDRT